MITRPWFELLETARIAIAVDYKAMRVCEFGSQVLRTKEIGCSSGKEYFTSLGAEHVSIDLNGRLGSLKMDLSKDLLLERPEWRGYFDMVTNFGTIEHVQDGIYEALVNVHNLCRQGGAMIHVGPLIGLWPGHSPYHFHEDFFKMLAQAAGYSCVTNELMTAIEGKRSKRPKICVCAVLVKQGDGPFMSRGEFESLGGIESGG